MAGDAVVGALRVVLGMDTATFEDGAKKAASSFEKFGANMGKVGVGIGLAVTAAAAGLGVAIKGVIDEADKLGKAAQKFGVPVEQLSALKFAAELSDVSLEALGKSFTVLSKNMQSVAGGAANIAAAAFDNLRISVKNADGGLKSTNEIFLDVAERFKDMQDGATKTALAVAIFGRAGAELIPLLNQGRDGIKSLTDEARALGIVIDEKTAKSAENLNDNLKRLSKVQEAVVLQILGSGGLLPAMENLSFRMVDAARNAESWRTVSDGLARALEATSTWVLVLVRALDTLTLPVQAIVLAMKRIIDLDFAGAWEAITGTLGRAIPNLKEIFRLVSQGQEDVSIWTNTVREATDALARLALIKFESKPFSENQFKLGEKFADTLAKMSLEARVLRGDFSALAPGFVQGAQQFKDLDGFGKSIGTTLAELTPKQRAFNAALAEMKAAQITQEFLTPWEDYRKKLAEINAVHAEGKFKVGEYEQATLRAALKMAEAWGQIAQSIVSPMADAFKTLAQMNKKYAGIAKAAAIGEAIVNTYLAATKALASVPPPFNFAAAAAVTAAGLVNVAKIASTDFAQGGSFKVGGAGGIDSQLVQFNATPGEMVDVRTPGQQRAASGEIVVRGMQPDDVFNGRWLRGFVDALNQGERDGYRLVFAER